jgi:hypothetical protein
MIEIKSPNKIIIPSYSLFLGGTIDMGNSQDWQKELKEFFENNSPQLQDWVILNPRRDNWDSSWSQHINNPQFKEQVIWELDAMDVADLRVFVFLPDSKSPITMLELGLYKDKPCVVYCPFEFYRSGNIHIICEKYNIPLYTDWEQFKKSFKL